LKSSTLAELRLPCPPACYFALLGGSRVPPPAPDDYVALVESGEAAEAGWPSSVNIASKIGQVAAVRIAARLHHEEARSRGILINAACPGLMDTDSSRPWFQDMSQAQSPDEAAADVLWLATLPAGTAEPYGELVQHKAVLPFRGAPLTAQNRTDA
jgi:carbonyl reductase 1